MPAFGGFHATRPWKNSVLRLERRLVFFGVQGDQESSRFNAEGRSVKTYRLEIYIANAGTPRSVKHLDLIPTPGRRDAATVKHCRLKASSQNGIFPRRLGAPALEQLTGTISSSPAIRRTRRVRGLKTHIPDYNDLRLKRRNALRKLAV